MELLAVAAIAWSVMCTLVLIGRANASRHKDCDCRRSRQELDALRAEVELLRELVVFMETRRRNRRRARGLGDESEP